jgi:membrane associated rhomboid family serine protease
LSENAQDLPQAELKTTLYTGDSNTVLDYSLLLASQNLDHWIAVSDKRWVLQVPNATANTCQQLMDIWTRENQKSEVDTSEFPNPEFRIEPLVILILPILAWFFLGLSDNPSLYYSAGTAWSEKIRAGEIWRCFTALSLHSDARHLLSNLISGYLILTLLKLRTPMSLVFPGLLIFSALANYAVAWSVGPEFRSLGFSTFVFAALGLLALTETKIAWRRRDRVFRQFTPVYSALLVVVMMGIGENSDVLAHFYGFISGCLLGLLMPQIKHLSRSHSLLLYCTGWFIFILSWTAALQFRF